MSSDTCSSSCSCSIVYLRASSFQRIASSASTRQTRTNKFGCLVRRRTVHPFCTCGADPVRTKTAKVMPSNGNGLRRRFRPLRIATTFAWPCRAESLDIDFVPSSSACPAAEKNGEMVWLLKYFYNKVKVPFRARWSSHVCLIVVLKLMRPSRVDSAGKRRSRFLGALPLSATTGSLQNACPRCPWRNFWSKCGRPLALVDHHAERDQGERHDAGEDIFEADTYTGRFPFRYRQRSSQVPLRGACRGHAKATVLRQVAPCRERSVRSSLRRGVLARVVALSQQPA